MEVGTKVKYVVYAELNSNEMASGGRMIAFPDMITES